ncbi:MAG: hypothetical protein OXC11_13405 [Rhodospirillales bacterium]|nr:hypothetical protein [Rhodospirillales bacterium]
MAVDLARVVAVQALVRGAARLPMTVQRVEPQEMGGMPVIQVTLHGLEWNKLFVDDGMAFSEEMATGAAKQELADFLIAEILRLADQRPGVGPL